MRWQAFALPLLIASLGAAIAIGQPAPVSRPAAAEDGGVCADPAATVARSASTAPEPAPPERDPCDEVLRAVQFEDVARAERSWRACRARVAPPGRILVEDDLRTLEDLTEALHGLRRPDGAFCVAPAAPFDLGAQLGSARDTRACFVALDRFLRSEDAVLRFLLDDGYAAGRLASRARFDVVAARRSRRSATPGSSVELEQVAVARLAGRQFMRACRCLPGAQPEAMTSVRAMRLPRTVEGVLLRGLAERGGGETP